MMERIQVLIMCAAWLEMQFEICVAKFTYVAARMEEIFDVISFRNER